MNTRAPLALLLWLLVGGLTGCTRPAADRSIVSAPANSADVHAGTLGSDCTRCHTTSGTYKGARENFDHTKNTRYPLIGMHQTAAEQQRCAACHKALMQRGGPLIFQVSSLACGSSECHERDDAHRGRRGMDCGGCHDTLVPAFQDARGVQRGHDLTPQPLGGAHDRLPCKSCHTVGRKLQGMGGACVSCHQRDDIHHNALGPACERCHTQRSFAGARFQHDSVGCTLRGAHRVLPCIDCHKGGNYDGLSPLCVSCHRDDAVRAAGAGIAPELHLYQTACTTCHNSSSFRMGFGTRPSPPESVCQ